MGNKRRKVAKVSKGAKQSQGQQSQGRKQSGHEPAQETRDDSGRWADMIEFGSAGVGFADPEFTRDAMSLDGSIVMDERSPLEEAARAAVEIRAGRLEQLPRPLVTRVMTGANQKGGVGKTTTTVNLAAGLALQGLNVLVLDLDPQGNASTALGIPHGPGVAGMYEVLLEGRRIAEVVRAVPEISHLWAVPATLDLAGAEIELVPAVAREHKLRRAISNYLDEHEQLYGRLDVVLIDCPPSLGLLTLNALVAANEVVIPIQCEYYALEGLTQLVSTVELVTAELNPTLHVSSILLTMFDGRTRLASQVADQVREHFGDRVLRTAIPRNVRVSEAPSFGQTVLTYDPGSPGALCYLQASRELILGPRA